MTGWPKAWLSSLPLRARPRIPVGCVVGARRSPLRSRTSALPDRAWMPRPMTRHLVETCLSAVALAVLCLAVGSPAQADDGQRVPGRTLFTIIDEDVFESSGLVDAGPVVYTTNDLSLIHI